MMTTELHYFSVHQLSDDKHVGFLVLNAEENASHGQCVLKLVAPIASLSLPMSISIGENQFVWRMNKQKQLDLFLLDENGQEETDAMGFIRQEYLTLQGNILVLNDLTGNM